MNGGDISDLTVAELREECKTRGITGYSKLNKAGLIALLSEGNEDATGDSKGKGKQVETIADLTVIELREECKTRGITGYSKLKKSELTALLSEGKEDATGESKGKGKQVENIADLSVVELREACKKLEIQGYSKLKKAELVELANEVSYTCHHSEKVNHPNYVERGVHKLLAEYHMEDQGGDGGTEWFEVTWQQARAAVLEFIRMDRERLKKK
ncbi:hypothetical protein HDU98_006936 [Podochytrium sp. JEL0797]|nr:hypothetical protein HDU98_006936 [Podochytrium sp. JEL0797]